MLRMETTTHSVGLPSSVGLWLARYYRIVDNRGNLSSFSVSFSFFCLFVCLFKLFRFLPCFYSVLSSSLKSLSWSYFHVIEHCVWSLQFGLIIFWFLPPPFLPGLFFSFSKLAQSSSVLQACCNYISLQWSLCLSPIPLKFPHYSIKSLY